MADEARNVEEEGPLDRFSAQFQLLTPANRAICLERIEALLLEQRQLPAVPA